MRKIVCARIKDTGEFDVVGVIAPRSQAPSKCPLTGSLIRMRGESYDNFFRDLVQLGALKWEDGHFGFTEIDHPCPYTQAQQLKGETHG